MFGDHCSSAIKCSSGQWFSNLSVLQNFLEGLLNYKLLGLTTPRVSDSVGLDCDLKIHISNRFPGMLVLSSTEHDLVHPGLVFIEETGAQRSQQVAQSHTACKWQSEDV